MIRRIIDLRKISHDGYIILKVLLTYPRYDKKILDERIEKLKELGIEALELRGPSLLFNKYQILGKGTVGIVLIGYLGGEKVVVKVLRTDAPISTMEKEAHFLKIANSVGVGPRYIKSSRDFLIREYIDGDVLGKWIRTKSIQEILKIFLDLLDQSYLLDKINLCHKQLSNLDKHVIIRKYDMKPFIIDFETASLNSKKRNLTQVVQYFLFRSKTLGRVLGENDIKDVLTLLSKYKREPSFKKLEEIKSYILSKYAKWGVL